MLVGKVYKMTPLLSANVKVRSLLVVGLIALVAAVACSTSPEQYVGPTPESRTATPTPTLEPTPESEAATPIPALTYLQPGEIPLIKGPVSPDGTQAIFGTPDLGVGESRVTFVLTTTGDLVRSLSAAVSSFLYPPDGSERVPKETVSAVFRPWPYGVRGFYTTQLTFDTPGNWGIEISIQDDEGSNRRADLAFEVKETPEAVAVGSPAVASRNKTLDRVESISQLTTGSLQDPDLYQTTISDAVASGLPTVVVMASPAFCTNAVCGPQVEVLQELKDRYKGEANFIHVDFYDNPDEIQGDLTKARLSPTVLEWGLPSTEWTFVIDRHGIVSDRFESFATLQELELALQEVS